jgi:hypothetical protein
MNASAQKKQKALNPAGKPSRAEIDRALSPFAQQAARAFIGLVDVTDLLLKKGVFSIEEFQAWIAERHPAPPIPAGIEVAAEPTVSAEEPVLVP